MHTTTKYYSDCLRDLISVKQLSLRGWVHVDTSGFESDFQCCSNISKSGCWLGSKAELKDQTPYAIYHAAFLPQPLIR